MTSATQSRTRPSRMRSRPHAWRPTLEALEDRWLLAAGALDTTFNSTGTQTLAFPGGSVTAAAVAVQPDSKVVVAGTFTASGTPAASDFAIARFNANGALDTTFGSGGSMTLDFGLPGSKQQATAVALQADGKIVVGGSVATNGSGTSEFALARLTSAGALDTSFGTGGKETLAFGSDDFLTGLVLQPADGKIVVAGHSDQASTASFVVARLNPDGNLDASFGNGGKQTISFGAFDVANAVTLQPDGKILLVGSTGSSSSSPNEVAVARLTSAGTLDGSFGSGGKAAINVAALNPNFAGDTTEGLAVTLQPDGKILVAGDSLSFGESFALVLRLNADGSQDPSFAKSPTAPTGPIGSGSVHVFFSLPLPGPLAFPTNSKATGVAVDAQNRIIVTGKATSTDTFFAYAFSKLDGSTFVSGLASASGTVSFGLGSAEAHALALAPGGTVVLAGSTTPPNGSGSFAVARIILPPPATTAATFDQTTGTWYLRNSNTPGPPDVTPFAYGAAGWIPEVGDWTGDGTATVGVFDPNTATWYLKNSNTPGAPDITFQYGAPGWIPVVGDWQGTGHTGIGVVDPATNTWYLKYTPSAGAPDIAPFQYGAPGTIPLAGDWDGRGRFTPGVFDPSSATWYLTIGSTVPTSFAYGAGSDRPVAGDWDGDGVWTVGVYDPSGNGSWLLRNSNSAGAPDVTPFAYGATNWTPVSGYFAGQPQQLQAADAQGPGASPLAYSQLNGIMTAALDRLPAADVAPATLALGSSVTAALPAGTLGLAYPQALPSVLDDDGSAWMTDALPSGTLRTDHLDAAFASAALAAS